MVPVLCASIGLTAVNFQDVVLMRDTLLQQDLHPLLQTRTLNGGYNKEEN